MLRPPERARLQRASKTAAWKRRKSVIRVDVQHGSPLSRYDGQALEPVSMLHNSQADRIPTMLCDLTEVTLSYFLRYRCFRNSRCAKDFVTARVWRRLAWNRCAEAEAQATL